MGLGISSLSSPATWTSIHLYTYTDIHFDFIESVCFYAFLRWSIFACSWPSSASFRGSDAPHATTFSFFLIGVICPTNLISMLYVLTWPVARDAHGARDDKFVIPSHMDERTSIHTYVHIHAYIRTYTLCMHVYVRMCVWMYGCPCGWGLQICHPQPNGHP